MTLSRVSVCVSAHLFLFAPLISRRVLTFVFFFMFGSVCEALSRKRRAVVSYIREV